MLMKFKLTTLEANLELILLIPLKNSTKLPFEKRQEDSVYSWPVFVLAFTCVFTLDEHELRLQWNILPAGSHSLRHPPQLESE